MPAIAPRGLKVLVCPSETLGAGFNPPHMRLSYFRPRVAQSGPSGYEVLGTSDSQQVLDWASAGTIGQARRKFRVKLNQIRDPAHTFAAVEFPETQVAQGMGANTDRSWTGVYLATPPMPHRGGKWNALFHDGHVDAVTEAESLGTGTPLAPRGMWTLDPND